MIEILLREGNQCIQGKVNLSFLCGNFVRNRHLTVKKVTEEFMVYTRYAVLRKLRKVGYHYSFSMKFSLQLFLEYGTEL